MWGCERDCIYIFGVVWGEARGGFRGKYGEDDVMGDVGGCMGEI